VYLHAAPLGHFGDLSPALAEPLEVRKSIIISVVEISGWIPDQLLLIVSVVLTHMAGVVPADWPFTIPRKHRLNDDVTLKGTSISVITVTDDGVGNDTNVRRRRERPDEELNTIDVITAFTDDGVGNVTDVGDENIKMKTMAVIIAIPDDEVGNVTKDENVKMKMMDVIIAITDDGVGNVIDVGDENVKMKTMVVIIVISDDGVGNVTDT
ncbi:hypothetical protein Tco_0979369, partial [Tanacetum coccineum]